ncbi:MAG: dipeptidase [Chloroflexia bacterium]
MTDTATSTKDMAGDELRRQIVRELTEFLRIPSISTQPEHRADIERAAQWAADYLRRAGLEHVAVIPTAVHPLVYADWLHAEGQPTVLVYGHYDVQPADPLDAWHTPPFEPSIRDGNIYARGAADDKGQLYIHLKAVAELLRAKGKLPVNVRFLIEGEEEIGGPSIEEYVEQHADALACDAVLVSDTPMYAEGQPTICTGLRGMLGAELSVQTGRQDLHSGLYGGAAPNAIHVLCHIVAGLTDAAGRPMLPSYYESVRQLAEEERASWARLPFDASEYNDKEIGAPALLEDAEYSPLERVWGRPTLDVNGILGGYTGAGSKAIIPAQASCKISLRLVPDQQPGAVFDLLRARIAALCPPYARFTLESLGASPPMLLPTDTPVMQAAAQALEAVFGVAPVFTRMGGSIPIVGLFVERLGAPCVLMGFGLPDDNLHAPNEKMKLGNIYQGIEASTAFLRLLRR